MDLLEKISKIDGISVQAGLDFADGKTDVYLKTLMLTVKETKKRSSRLKLLLALGNMKDFSLEVHSMKSALAAIGAVNMSLEAHSLETASGKNDISAVTATLSLFLENLDAFFANFNDLDIDGEAFAFTEKKDNDKKITLTPELLAALKGIFINLSSAIDKMDFLAIDNEIENLNSVNAGNFLQKEIEKIKDAVLVMDYEEALTIINSIQTKMGTSPA